MIINKSFVQIDGERGRVPTRIDCACTIEMLLLGFGSNIHERPLLLLWKPPGAFEIWFASLPIKMLVRCKIIKRSRLGFITLSV